MDMSNGKPLIKYTIVNNDVVLAQVVMFDKIKYAADELVNRI